MKDNKSASKKTAENKPPIGLTPRRIHDTTRIENIHMAMGRYISDAKQIPADWAKELLELSNSTFIK